MKINASIEYSCKITFFHESTFVLKKYFSPVKFLFIRFSSIGDIVLTTPVIRCVKKQVENAEVHFLLKKSYAPVLQHNPYIDKKFYFEDNESELISLLKKEKYDVVVDLQKNVRSLRIKSSLGVKSFTFDKLNLRKWIYVNFKINLLPDKHIVDRYMESVKSLGVNNDGDGLDYFISEEDESVLTSIPLSHSNGYVAWVIGARHFTKRIPPEKMLSIARKIKLPVVLIGGQEDHETGELLIRQNPKQFFNACGKYSLNESAALVKFANKIITNDTGMMHIAAAFNKDIISVWGNTIPAFGMYPYGKIGPGSIMLEVDGLSCRPCSKIGYAKCPRGHFKCMRQINEDAFEKL